MASKPQKLKIKACFTSIDLLRSNSEEYLIIHTHEEAITIITTLSKWLSFTNNAET